MIDALCIAAHPDDVELGMGGTVAGMARQGLKVALVDLTDGEPTPAGTREIRLREAAEAARRLGVSDRRTLPFPNRELQDSLDARRALAEVIRELHPRLVFAPYPVDAHPDHVAASAIAEAARFWAKLVKTDMAGTPHYPARVYHFLSVHLRLHAKPSFIVDVSADLTAKVEALRCYTSQFVANPKNAHLLEDVEIQARYWGALIGVRFGEPFYSREEVGVRSVAHLV